MEGSKREYFITQMTRYAHIKIYCCNNIEQLSELTSRLNCIKDCYYKYKQILLKSKRIKKDLKEKKRLQKTKREQKKKLEIDILNFYIFAHYMNFSWVNVMHGNSMLQKSGVPLYYIFQGEKEVRDFEKIFKIFKPYMPSVLKEFLRCEGGIFAYNINKKIKRAYKRYVRMFEEIKKGMNKYKSSMFTFEVEGSYCGENLLTYEEFKKLNSTKHFSSDNINFHKIHNDFTLHTMQYVDFWTELNISKDRTVTGNDRKTIEQQFFKKVVSREKKKELVISDNCGINDSTIKPKISQVIERLKRNNKFFLKIFEKNNNEINEKFEGIEEKMKNIYLQEGNFLKQNKQEIFSFFLFYCNKLDEMNSLSQRLIDGNVKFCRSIYEEIQSIYREDFEYITFRYNDLFDFFPFQIKSINGEVSDNLRERDSAKLPKVKSLLPFMEKPVEDIVYTNVD